MCFSVYVVIVAEVSWRVMGAGYIGARSNAHARTTHGHVMFRWHDVPLMTLESERITAKSWWRRQVSRHIAITAQYGDPGG